VVILPFDRFGLKIGAEMAAARHRQRIRGEELVDQLNEVVVELIKENRKLKRQVEKLTARSTSAASRTVDRSLRTMQLRVAKALATQTRRRRRRTVPSLAEKARRDGARKAV
jgi:cell division septum initiation protein DivIVA